jgi:hypothetical protein
MANEYSQFTFDKLLELKPSTLVAASEDTAILDLGDGLVDGYIVIDASVIDPAGTHTISVEASNTADMTAGSACVAQKVLGAVVAPMDDPVSTPGRYVIPFRNEEGGMILRYVRLSINVAGGSGIEFSAFIASRT